MPSNDFSFPKSRRLTTAADFDRVRQNGSPHRGKLLLLNAIQVGDKTFRAGFVTSKKVGNAAVRNRVRRRLREIVRKHQHEIAHGVWVVTVARDAAARASFVELEHAWLLLARRASILTG
jgi:ribonuclease P protein component